MLPVVGKGTRGVVVQLGLSAHAMGVLAAEDGRDLEAMAGLAPLTDVRIGAVNLGRVADVVVVTRHCLRDERGRCRVISRRPGEPPLQLGDLRREFGDTLGTAFRGTVVGEVVVLVHDAVSGCLNRLRVLKVRAPHPVTGVARVADEDAGLGAGLQRSLVGLHDVGRREGDAEGGHVGDLIGEALVGRDEAWVGRRGRAVDDMIGHVPSETPVSLVDAAMHAEGGD